MLELKSVADVGLVGFPSAGKSSLVAALSAARPKIADYPFTTLQPNLGVVQAGGTTYTVADVPGLIPGAAQGKGLGIEFLRHIERCAVLLHVIDCATEEPGRDPVADIEAIEHELAQYDTSLASRPRLVALNKVDVPDARDLAEIVRPDLAERGWPVFEISAATHEGLTELSYALATEVERYRASLPTPEPTRIVLRPAGVDDGGFTVERDPADPEAFVVRGERPERWVRQTDFGNDEAVGYLADRLARLGVEDELVKAGAVAGSGVTIGEVTFDWEPTLGNAAEFVEGPRGTDARVESNDRTSAVERLVAYRTAARGHRSGRGRVAGGRRRARGGAGPAPATRPRRRPAPAMSVRDTVRDGHRLVVKVGSSSLTTAAGGLDPDRLDALVDVLGARRAAGTQVVLVSSGAIAAGLAPLRLPSRPRDLATQQAAASVGQMLLVERYASSFARSGLLVGQVLLTANDLVRRAHYRNANRTLERLLSLGVVPVVNENDAVATEEIRFGDNDRLAALVAHLVAADALVLLSDVDGLYDGDPRRPGARLLSEVRGEADLTGVRVGRPGRPVSAPAGWPASSTPPGSPPGPAYRSCWRRPSRWPPRWPASRSVPRSRRRPAHRVPAVLAAARDHPTRAAGARRRRGGGGRAAPYLAAVGRRHRRRGRLRRRGPGRAGRAGRRAGRPRPRRVRRRRTARPARPVHHGPRPGAPARGRTPGRSGPPARMTAPDAVTVRTRGVNSQSVSWCRF